MTRNPTIRPVGSILFGRRLITSEGSQGCIGGLAGMFWLFDWAAASARARACCNRARASFSSTSSSASTSEYFGAGLPSLARSSFICLRN